MRTNVWIVLLLFPLAISALGWAENFDHEAGPGLPAGWKTFGGEWTVKASALWRKGTGPASYAVMEQSGAGSDVVVEATVLVRRREGDGWCVTGVAIRQDASNFWHLALVEAPLDKKGTHYVELLQCLGGVRNAQSDAATRLVKLANTGDTFAWEYNRAYRLRLTMRGGRIEGTVTEPDGTLRTDLAYDLKDPSVRSGTPALLATQTVVVFDDLRADVAKP